MKCSDCQHASFNLTPTGRIKKLIAGHCDKAMVLASMFNLNTVVAPCLLHPSPAHIVCIWPDYDATHCTEFLIKANAIGS